MPFTKKKKLTKHQRIDNVYANIKNPSSFTSIANLKKNVDSKINDEDIKKYLQASLTYTLHKPAKKKMIHPKVKALSIDNVWMMDLAEFGNIAKYNDGVRYVLFVIDVFSKFLFVRTLKTKKGEEVADQFADIINKSQRKPGITVSDQGGEFHCPPMREIMETLNIQHIVTGSQVKASVVERCIKSIKQRMYKYFTHANTLHYLNVLQQIVHNYNRTIHTTTKHKPVDINYSNEEDVYNHAFKDGRVVHKREENIEKGDYVRLAILKGMYKKGYEMSHTPEVYIVDDIINKPKNVKMYRLRDFDGEVIKGAFLNEEIQKVTFDPQATYPIEKILETRGKGRSKVYKVRWLYWPKHFDSYVNAAHINKIKQHNG